MMETTLNRLKPKASGIVKWVSGAGAIRRRLFDMGITPGTKIFVRKVAPLGDPLEISLRGYELSLRKGEAESILIVTEGKEGV